MSTLLNIARKGFFLYTVIVLISTSTCAQDAISSEEHFPYNEALRATLEAMNRDFGNLDLTYRGTRAPIDFQNMIVRKDPALTDELNSQFWGISRYILGRYFANRPMEKAKKNSRFLLPDAWQQASLRA